MEIYVCCCEGNCQIYWWNGVRELLLYRQVGEVLSVIYVSDS